MKSCFFIGHREAPGTIMPRLEEAVVRHIAELGITDFYVGNYGSFDRLAARAVLNAKKQYGGVSLYLLLPYHPAERPVTLMPGFDGSFYPPGMEKVPRRLAIIRANRYMVDHVDHLIAYAWHPAGNARELTAYAHKKGCHVTNIAEMSLANLPAAGSTAAAE